MHEMCEAARAGDAEKAAEIDAKLAALHQDLFVEANPIPVKWALHEMGLIPEGIRLPLTVLSSEYHERVRAALRQAEVL
jgi:4-hydroxy-tetrahydrodipicolinate synthase